MRSLRAMFGTPSRTPFRDPAPTRWAYRYQRLMLTPAFRSTLRIGAPLALLVFIVGYWTAQDENRAAFAAQVADIKENFQQRPEFMVTDMEINGANISVAAAISSIVTTEFPVSSWDLDLIGFRDKIIELSAVQDAVVRIRPGGTLEIAVNEHEPVAIWRHIDGLRLIDEQANFISMIPQRGDRSDLPLIAGDGAMDEIEQAMALFDAASPVADRVRGLVRMGERRWDLVLDRNQRILLPEEGPVAALDRVVALHLAQDMLSRDIAVVDMRNAGRPTVRLGGMAVTSLHRIEAQEPILPDLGQAEQNQ